MAVDFVCGFECRLLVTGAAVTPDENHWDANAAAGASISTTTVRSGTAAFRNNVSATTGNINKTIARTTVAGRFYIRFATLPSSGQNPIVLSCTNANGNLNLRVADTGQLTAVAGAGSAANVGSPMSTGTWYRIDFLADSSTGTASMKARLDGGTEGSSTVSQVSVNMTVVRIGVFTSSTCDVFFDDFILGTASGDYPFGAGTVERMKPTRDSSHSFTAGDFGYDTAGGDVATSATDVWDKLNDDDLSSTADLIRQKVIRTTGYVQVGFGTAPYTDDFAIQAVNVVSSFHAAGTGADTFGLKLNDGGTLKTLTNEAGTGLSDVSQTTIVFAEKVLTVAPSTSAAWTKAKLDAVLVRGGYSDDVNAIPYWDGLMLEVAYAAPVEVPGLATLTLATFAPTVTVAATGTTVTPPTATLVTATFAPTVTATANQLVTPGLATLTTTGYIPVLNLTVIPPKALGPGGISLNISNPPPTVTVSDNQLVIPGPDQWALISYAPTVTASNHQIAVPGVKTLTLTAFAPSVAVSDNQRVTPGVATVTLTTFAPTVTALDFKLVTPDPASLTTAAFSPTVATTAHQTAIPDPASLLLTGYSPTVPVGDAQIAQPDTAALALTTFAPTVLAVEDTRVVPGVAVVNLTPYVPLVIGTANQFVRPGTKALHLSSYRPEVTATRTEGKPAPPRYVSFPDFIPGREIVVRPRTTRLHLTPFPPAVILDDRIPQEELALITLGIV